MGSLKKVVLYLRIVMPVLFLAIGVYCLVLPEKVKLDPQISKMFGFMLIAYALFRGYRAYKALKEDQS